MKPKLDEFISPEGEGKVIWLGHSSFLLRIKGKTVLVDPVLGPAASPVSFVVKRFQKPVLELEELPHIDFIVISHDHYDHLDQFTVDFFVDKEAIFITPLGVGSHLKGWGIAEERIIERDWWESVTLSTIEFIATPAQHFSGRDGVHENETLWASWVIRSEDQSVFFSGDSGYDTHFREIGERYGPFDIALLESGQYNSSWREVHMFPAEAVKALKDLKGRKFFPVHWGMFELAFHPWDEPVEKLFSFSRNNEFELIIPLMGEIVEINKPFKTNTWWRQVK